MGSVVLESETTDAMNASGQNTQWEGWNAVPEPNAEQWLELHEAFREYCGLYPWANFDDTDLVAVEIPGREEKGYCIVLGSGGIEQGLAVYRGDDGLAGFLAVMSGLVDPGSTDVPEYDQRGLCHAGRPGGPGPGGP